MPGYSLHQLDQRTVAVEFPCCDDKRVVRGRGRLVKSPTNDATALHVIVHGVAEYFELVFDLARFSGRIEHGARFACDYAIRLDEAANPFLPGTASRHSAAA